MFISAAFLSYAIAAMAFLLLSISLMTIWRGRLYSTSISICCLVTAIWAAVLSYQLFFDIPLGLTTQILEFFRGAAWIIFLLVVLNPQKQFNLFLLLKSRTYVVIVIAILFLQFLAVVFSNVVIDSDNVILKQYSISGGWVGVSVIGMLLIEHLFRNIPDTNRWGIKFACLGIGGLFVYDFYLYSDAMLFNKINPDIWTARGIIDALTVPLLAISVARNSLWSQGILVSRSVLFHSATLFGTAFYLMAMAAAGYYLRYFGGSWGVVMQVVFLFGALILLLVLLFSGSVRAWLKVFISKHFYNYNYDYREEWIRFTRTLSTEGPDLGERSIRALAQLVESPAAALFISRESGKCEPSSQWNMQLNSSAEALDSGFCKLLEMKQWVIDLHNFDIHSETYENVALPEWLKNYSRAWLVLPLILQGKLFGFVVLAESRSHIKLNWEVLDLLKIAGTQAASYLAQQDSANALMVARQFESFNRMSTFMVHDLKNLVAQLSLLLSNAEKHKANPEFQKDMIDTIDHSVQKMKVLLQKLSRGVSVDDRSKINLPDLLRQSVDSKSPYEPKPLLEINGSDFTVDANAERLERVIGHIIQNAIEATPKDGNVIVRLSQQGKYALIEIIDSGIGMTQEFIQTKLFSPFVSTKLAGMGIGVFETKAYVQELGGQLEVCSTPSVGTTFRINLLISESKNNLV